MVGTGVLLAFTGGGILPGSALAIGGVAFMYGTNELISSGQNWLYRRFGIE